MLSKGGTMSKIDKIIDERQQEGLSETKDKSTGTSNGSTSVPFRPPNFGILRNSKLPKNMSWNQQNNCMKLRVRQNNIYKHSLYNKIWKSNVLILDV